MYDNNCDECGGYGTKYLSDDVYVSCDCKYDIIGKMKILFGKYKGQCFKDLPLNYLRWCYTNNIFLPKNERIHDYIYYIIDMET